jgi:hypothetical protein
MDQAFITQPKRIVLILAGVFSAILDLFVVLLLAWCHFDSLERRQPLYPWLRAVILFLGPFALFIYLFKAEAGLTDVVGKQFDEPVVVAWWD